LANRDLTPEYALTLGRAAARRLGVARMVVGRDTRASGPLLEAALSAGLASEGCEVTSLGVCPTPAVAWAAAHLGVGGAVISASHNPSPDNGIKLFAAGGLKLDDHAQGELETELEAVRRGAADADRPVDGAVGHLGTSAELLEGYRRAVLASAGGRRLDGLRVVVDCANGAASGLAPATLAELGAELVVLADQPDGANINRGCGSTHLDGIRQAVRRHGADLGVAFDGDADRVLAVDHDGEVVDGDQLIAIFAIDLHRRGELPGDTVVVTVMANQGFRLGMRRHGITVHETAVGDRYVLEALEGGAWALGGEQSGHVIFRRLATTGDGLLTAVQLLDLVRRRERPLAELVAEAMTRLPQVLRNVRLAHPVGNLADALGPLVEAVQRRLGEEGRVLIRPSGTEPLVRVMVEAADLPTAEAASAELVAAVEHRLGLPASG
jgi:phosphoglucosamine mutase